VSSTVGGAGLQHFQIRGTCECAHSLQLGFWSLRYRDVATLHHTLELAHPSRVWALQPFIGRLLNLLSYVGLFCGKGSLHSAAVILRLACCQLAPVTPLSCCHFAHADRLRPAAQGLWSLHPYHLPRQCSGAAVRGPVQGGCCRPHLQR
jgi:hypothetical protein